MQQRKRAWFLYLAAVLLAGRLVLGGSPASAAGAAESMEEEIVKLVAQFLPSVVTILYRIDPATPDPLSGKWGGKVSGSGSGFIIDNRGLIVTNAHVLGEAPASLPFKMALTGMGAGQFQENITVVLADGRELKARKLGSSPASDLALLKVEAKDLQAAALGDSDLLRVGQWAIAIGSPIGLKETVTVGVISALSRIGFGPTKTEDYIQTSAAINPGNSGGPLIDIRGRVIGVNSRTVERSGSGRPIQGIHLAIPINRAKQIIAPWMKKM